MKVIKEIGLYLVLVALTGCSAIKTLSTETVYHYHNGFVTDRNNNVAFYYANGFVEKHLDKSIKINDDLELVRLTPDCFLYTAWSDIENWGRIGSNGLVLISNGKALLIDSPTLESQTVELAWWFDKNLDVKFEAFVPGHWHDDCVGGINWLNRNGVKTYANSLTNQILASKGLPQAKESFSDSLTLTIGNTKAELYYLGGGHSTDNIVVWIPSQKILFGGCMLKSSTAKSIGNTSDAAPLHEWLQTVNRVEQQFPEAEIVVPGHGEYGGKELFKHTEKIIQDEFTICLHDSARNRAIPIAIYQPKEESPKTKVIIFNHGYDGNKNSKSNQTYEYLTHFLMEKGFYVVSIQHELPGDPLLSMEGDFMKTRMPNWKRGEENILFTIQSLKKMKPDLDWNKLIMIGHSNGGDMTMLVATEHPQLIYKAISLDHRRMVMPRTKRPLLYTLRGCDYDADPGVLPNKQEQIKYKTTIVHLDGITHSNMGENGTEKQHDVINQYVYSFIK